MKTRDGKRRVQVRIKQNVLSEHNITLEVYHILMPPHTVPCIPNLKEVASAVPKIQVRENHNT